MRVEKLKRLLARGATIGGAAFALVAGMFIGGYSGNAEATAAFARQTGMSCFACHTRPPSMTAVGKRFFLQGYRMPNIRQTMEHGEQGTDGGRFKIGLDELQWWRIRSTPLIQEKGKTTADPDNQDEWFSMFVQRFSWGVAGPIGDYMAIWNEIYYQPYDNDPDGFAPGGSQRNANSRGNWRQSLVEVDELEIVWGRELPGLSPGNYFGFNFSDRGYRKVQNRGGTTIHSAVSGAEGDNGGIGVFGFWDDQYYVNLHFLPGASVNWDKMDIQLNLGWWPRSSQQDDLYMDVLFTLAQDSGPQLRTTSFGSVPNIKDEGRAIDYRVQYIKADWGVHTIDTEAGIGWIENKNNVDLASSNEFEGIRTSAGARYWYKRRWGAEILFTKWLKFEETLNATGETVKYNRKAAWDVGLLYQIAANALISFEIRQDVGSPFLPGAPDPETFDTYEVKLEIGF